MITLEALFVQAVDDHGEAGGGEQGDEDSVDSSGLSDPVLVRETPVEEEEPVNAAQRQSDVVGESKIRTSITVMRLSKGQNILSRSKSKSKV